MSRHAEKAGNSRQVWGRRNTLSHTGFLGQDFPELLFKYSPSFQKWKQNTYPFLDCSATSPSVLGVSARANTPQHCLPVGTHPVASSEPDTCM